MKGLIEIFYAPGIVFDRVRDQKAWVAPLLAGLILFLAFFAYYTEQIGGGNIVRQQFEGSKFAAQMPAEQKADAIAKADTTPVKIRTTAFAGVGFLVVTSIFALLFMAIAAVSGSRIKFTQALGTVAYASWPLSIVKYILSVVVIFLATDKSDLDPQHLLAFNAGAFLDKATAAKPLYTFFSALDILLFAQIALAAWGLSRVANITFAKSLTGNILVWLVFTLIGVGFSFIF